MNIDVKNEIIYLKKGTRSERREGKLIVNGNYLPDIFVYVEADGKGYTFIKNNSPFGNSGYFPAEEQKNIPDSKMLFEKSYLKKRFYEGKYRLINTPGSYIYVEWENGSAFIDSWKLTEIMKIKPFSEIKSLKNNPYKKRF